MDLAKKISALQSSAERQLPALTTQKKTETALVLPFFEALGYDPFDIREVESEYDVGLEEWGVPTVDYAVKRGSSPLMFFQCQEAPADPSRFEKSVFFRSFDELGADVVVFTNGLRYLFYANAGTELQDRRRPYFEFDLLNYSPEDVTELRRLTNSAFDIQEILSAAYDRRCSRLLKRYFARQQTSPDDHLVRFLAGKVLGGEVSEDALERSRPVVQSLLGELVGDGAEFQPSRPEEDGEATMSGAAGPQANRKAGEETEDPFDKDLARRVIDDI